MHLNKIRVFYKPSLSNDFNWKLREFVEVEVDSDSGVREGYVETFSKDLKRKDAVSAINKKDDAGNTNSITRRNMNQNKRVAQAMASLKKINWKTQNNGTLTLKGQRF